MNIENTGWQKSTFSGAEGPNCIEVTARSGNVLIRESDAPDFVVSTGPAALRALIRAVKSGRYDQPVAVADQRDR